METGKYETWRDPDGDGNFDEGIFGDYDGDRRPDLYVVRVGTNLLYRNVGDGSFEEVTETAGVAGPGGGAGPTGQARLGRARSVRARSSGRRDQHHRHDALDAFLGVAEVDQAKPFESEELVDFFDGLALGFDEARESSRRNDGDFRAGQSGSASANSGN